MARLRREPSLACLAAAQHLADDAQEGVLILPPLRAGGPVALRASLVPAARRQEALVVLQPGRRRGAEDESTE